MIRRPHLEALTALRFVAAGFIFVHHILGKFGLPSHREVGLLFGIGVPFFFALSGFILAYNYEPSRDPRRIFQVIGYRIARIWPLHVVCICLYLLLLRNPQNPLQGMDQIIPNIFLIHSWFGSYYYSFSFNAVSWSLSTELFFYICFPFLILVRSRFLVILGIATSVIMVWVANYFWVSIPMRDPAVSGLAIITTHPLATLHVFIAGIVAKRLFDRLTFDPSATLATMLEVVAIAMFILFMFYHREVTSFVGALVQAKGAFTRWLPSTLGIFAFGPAIMILAMEKGMVSKLLSARWLVFLGEISFAFYLCHQFLLGWLHKSYKLGPVEGVFLGFAISVALAALLHRFVERPGQRVLRKVVDLATAKRVALSFAKQESVVPAETKSVKR